MKLSILGVGFVAFVIAFLVDPSWLVWVTVSLEEQDDPVRKSTQTAWAALKRAGIIKTSDVDVVEFGNGVGLRLNGTVKEGHVMMEVPQEFAFTGESWAHMWADDPSTNVTASSNLTDDNATQYYGVEPLVAEVATEFWIGDENSCKACSILRPLLPSLEWISNHGLFSLSEEFPLLTHGTSMEHWFDMGTRVTEDVHRRLNSVFPGQLNIDQVRWAYLITMMHSTRPKTLPRPTVLVPVILARPTATKENSPVLIHDRDTGSYKFLANSEMTGGNEFFAYDPTLSDASALCYRGLWFTRKHRMELMCELTSSLDAATADVLEKYDCIGQGSSWALDPKPFLRLFVTHHHRQIPKHFMSCLRLLAASKEGSDGSQLHALDKRGYMDKWPETTLISQQNELSAVELALQLLQKKVDAMMAGNKKVRATFGSDNVAARPTTKVREAETMILVSLLKSMNELHLVVSSHDLYAQLKEREAQG